MPLTYLFSFLRLWALSSWLIIRTTRTSNPLQHPPPTPLLSSLYNQNLQFPLPQVFSNQDELLSRARLSASEGYLSEEVIPFLGHSNQHMTFKKVRWALRFPLSPPVKRSRCPPFFFHSRFSTGPSQWRSGHT